MYPYLKDSSFLKKVDKERLKEQYVKITVLDFFSEKPINTIEGRVISGSLNLDGNSSVRRTCNLNMIAFEQDNNLTDVNNLLSINKKVKIEIGFLNIFDEYTNYKIIWFPLGYYVIFNPTISHNTQGINISLQLKDKMSLLNGDCGGTLPASVTFHEYETVDENGKYIIVQPTIYQIIQELVNHYGGEQLSKIIISDVDTRIKKVMKWTGNSPLFLYRIEKDGTIQNMATTDETVLNNIDDYKPYDYGSDIGYILTDFVYPGELIGDAGNSVCDILDKIKNTLGNYEYFYDIEGNFVFQEIKNYLNTSQAKVEIDKLNKEDYLIDSSKGKSIYTFDDSLLITSYSNAPQFNMIKNDFIVWGIRKDALDNTYPIRYHLAIDKKPKVGNTYKVFFYKDSTDNLIKAKCPIVFSSKGGFPRIGVQEVFYMTEDTNEIFEWDPIEKEYTLIDVALEDIVAKDWRTELYLSGTSAEPLGIDSNYYYPELKNEWIKLYDIKNGEFYPEVLEYPSDIDFYLDFIDSTASISELNISNIGRRSKIINDDSINCVFEPEIPDLVLIEVNTEETNKLRQECEERGQDYIQLDNNIFSMIATGGAFNSAYNLVRELLYQYTSYNESITLNTIPIYYLEPNTRITVRDNQSGIFGDYMIKSMTIPLDTSSVMTISCTKALERI